MAKPIQFVADGFSCSAEIEKFERSKVYGWVETKVFDDTGEPCSVASLLEDGKTMIPAGGFSLKLLTADGFEVSRKDLVARDAGGASMTQIPSVFERPVTLRADVTLEDYLSLQVKSVYQLTIDSGKDELMKALAVNGVMGFDFNYRAGYELDTGYMLVADGQVFAVIGRPAALEFIKLESEPDLTEDESVESEEDFDFGML